MAIVRHAVLRPAERAIVGKMPPPGAELCKGHQASTSVDMVSVVLVGEGEVSRLSSAGESRSASRFRSLRDFRRLSLFRSLRDFRRLSFFRSLRDFRRLSFFRSLKDFQVPPTLLHPPTSTSSIRRIVLILRCYRPVLHSELNRTHTFARQKQSPAQDRIHGATHGPRRNNAPR